MIDDDILRTRVRTAGIVHEHFKIQGARFEMYDVGGQRNERRKWLGSFNDITAVIFVAAISEYNQVLFEDRTVNRQDEAVELFRDTMVSEPFLDIPFILFLNKTDLLRKKLPHIPFRYEGDKKTPARNLEFKGPHCDRKKKYELDGPDADFEVCYDSARRYLQNLYELQKPDNKPHMVYTKFTNSTSSENINHIMHACRDIILRGQLGRGGFYAVDDDDEI